MNDRKCHHLREDAAAAAAAEARNLTLVQWKKESERVQVNVLFMSL